VYAVSTATLQDSLDPLEGHPDYYRRRRVAVVVTRGGGRPEAEESSSAWLYFLEDAGALRDVEARPDAYPRIEGGDYNSIF